MTAITKTTFDTTGFTTAITGTAGKNIYIVGIVITNNATSVGDYTFVRFGDDTDLQYGSNTGGIFLCGEAGSWGLAMTRDSLKHPYFITGSTGDNIYIQSVNSTRISGVIWYYEV